jgi:hypothetical protein
MGPARQVARLATLILTNPSHACLNTPFAAVYGRFGFAAHRASSSQYKPEWQAVRDAEIRWQIARVLRYRFGFLGGGASSSSGS